MSFVEVGEVSGFQRTTTFYHDFKARFGMAPAEYRKLKVKSEKGRVKREEFATAQHSNRK